MILNPSIAFSSNWTIGASPTSCLRATQTMTMTMRRAKTKKRTRTSSRPSSVSPMKGNSFVWRYHKVTIAA
jgi:hypothetical protein